MQQAYCRFEFYSACLQISSNPIGSEGALVLLMALDRNDSSCLNYMELMVSAALMQWALKRCDG